LVEKATVAMPDVAVNASVSESVGLVVAMT